MNAAVKIGVTGGIGSGKSTICRVFSCLGVPVYAADDRAKWLIENDPAIRKEIIEVLGDRAYTSAGRYDTQFVSSKVFNNKALLTKINHIVHPRVRRDTEAWFEKHRQFPYVVKEAAIMARAGQESGLDFVVGVISPEELRVNRVVQRDTQRTREQIAAIIANQISDEQLRELADFLIINNETQLIIPQVLAIHNKFTDKKVAFQ